LYVSFFSFPSSVCLSVCLSWVEGLSFSLSRQSSIRREGSDFSKKIVFCFL
jgi:hypothetical protein